jgi:uncharacterized glyoxalase superfamily protein PhnB
VVVASGAGGDVAGAPCGFVDRALDRTQALLFTATPTDELDEIGRWQQLKDQAFAGQVRAIVAAYNLPLEKQMWGDVFGMCTDRFGIGWMVDITS